MKERARLVRTCLEAGAVSTTDALRLSSGWALTSTAPGTCASPRELPSDPAAWRGAVVPGTVAASVGPPDLDRHEDYDASDWWYRTSFSCPPTETPAQARLRFDGLATLAEVWLNGELVLESSNMFCAYEVEVGDLLSGENDLVIVFRSLGAALQERRPRPRWKTKLVEEQQLRWFRTTLLGRIPGWTPAIKPVGPWRSVWLETDPVVSVRTAGVRAALSAERATVFVELEATPVDPTAQLESAKVRVGEQLLPLDVSADGGTWSVRGTPEVETPRLWWPATHGEPALYDCILELETSAGPIAIDCGRIGFRSIALDTSDGGIQFVVNGVPIFCRGSCWTNNDIVSLVGRPERMRSILEQAAGAHANMIRVGGTMVYETDEFYRTCDELGLLVWQDFMFANMDYPVDDPGFSTSIGQEAEQALRRLSRHPSVAACCGGSEVEQQASMFGAPRDIWSNVFFSETLPSLVEAHAPGTPYWPSTPTGGFLPFHVGEGLTHYYGVGAYKRPLDDARLAGVRFTPECLGFSHVPGADNLRQLTARGSVPPHHPAWKAGVPRDSGPGWDFEDIRDFYLERLHGVDAVRLRSEHLDRYLELSRTVTGEAMASVYSEWRHDGNPCTGGLTWFLNDLRPGAGWGLFDSDGEPKATLHYLRRAWAPRCVRLLGRGLDGLVAIILNDGAEPLDAALQLVVLGEGGVVLAEAEDTLTVGSRSMRSTGVEAVFGMFLDSTHSYRFGPPRHEAVVARLRAGDRVLSEDVYIVSDSTTTPVRTIQADVSSRVDGTLLLSLAADVPAYDVRVRVRDHRADDDHFCLTPGRARSISLERITESDRPFQGYVEARNLRTPVRLTAPGTADG